MELSKDDVLKILKIIDESGYDDVRLEVGDFKLHVQKRGAHALPPDARDVVADAGATAHTDAPASAAGSPQPSVAPSPAAPETIPAGMVAVRAPMLGTFYRAPAPGEKPFVEIGDEVTPETTLCLVEVMKLFNSIKAGVTGRVAQILVDNGAMVEHGQVLMLIEPK